MNSISSQLFQSFPCEIWAIIKHFDWQEISCVMVLRRDRLRAHALMGGIGQNTSYLTLVKAAYIRIAWVLYLYYLY